MQDCNAAPAFPHHSQSLICLAQSRPSLDDSPCCFNQSTVCHSRFCRCHQSRISLGLGYCLWTSWLIYLTPSGRMISSVWSLMLIFLALENSFRLNYATERQLLTDRLFSNTFRPGLTVIRWLVKMISALASKNLLAGWALINVPSIPM